MSGNGNGSSSELTTACHRAVNAVDGHFPAGCISRADPYVETYCFERDERKDTSGDGWADVYQARRERDAELAAHKQPSTRPEPA